MAGACKRSALPRNLATPRVAASPAAETWTAASDAAQAPTRRGEQDQTQPSAPTTPRTLKRPTGGPDGVEYSEDGRPIPSRDNPATVVCKGEVLEVAPTHKMWFFRRSVEGGWVCCGSKWKEIIEQQVGLPFEFPHAVNVKSATEAA
jgi:hypothetical protein